MTEDIKLAKKRKSRRSSINGVRNKLTVEGKDPKFVYRVVTDEGDRVQQFIDRDYEVVVDDNIQVGDRRVANPSQSGSPVHISVGKGQKGVLMRIPKEYYEDDQKEKAKLVDEQVAAMKAEAKKNADYGTFTISDK